MRFTDELRQAAASVWDAQHEHPFVRGIGDGTLAASKFRHYLRQDYLFLIDFARLLALGCARARRLDEMSRFAELAQAVLTSEMELHRAYANEWGVSAAELEAERPTATTRAYTDFLLRTGALGDYAELVAALLPCMWGYHELATTLAAQGRPGNDRFVRWIEMYADPDFGALTGWCRDLTDAAAQSGDRSRMADAFAASSRHELAFWEASWREEEPLMGD
jgi:thiaminase/transcriptional activator TenA